MNLEPHLNDKIVIDEEDSKFVSSIYQMNIIKKIPNKLNIEFGDDGHESVNKESFVGTSENEFENDDLDIIIVNIKFVKELMLILIE